MKNSLQRTCSVHVRWLQDTKFLQQLSNDNIDMNIIKNEFYPEEKCRKQNELKQAVLNILNCYPLQIIIAVLVLIDAGIIIAEIVLEIHAMKNKIGAYGEQMRETIHILNRIYTRKGSSPSHKPGKSDGKYYSTPHSSSNAVNGEGSGGSSNTGYSKGSTGTGTQNTENNNDHSHDEIDMLHQLITKLSVNSDWASTLSPCISKSLLTSNIRVSSSTILPVRKLFTGSSKSGRSKNNNNNLLHNNRNNNNNDKSNITISISQITDAISAQFSESTSLSKKLANISIGYLIQTAASWNNNNNNNDNNSSNQIDNNDKDDDSMYHNHRIEIGNRQYRYFELHEASEKLHFASIGILTFFVIELSVRVACIGPSFFKARFELIDALVILTSFIADVVIVTVGSQEISIMIIFLLWRIVRVINGLLMHEKKKDEFRIYLQKKARRISEIKLDELNIEKEMQEKHCIALEELCVRYNIPNDVIMKCRPKLTQLHKCHTNNPLRSIAALTTGFMGNLVGGHTPGKIMQKLAASSNNNSNSNSPVLPTKKYTNPWQGNNSYYQYLYPPSDNRLPKPENIIAQKKRRTNTDDNNNEAVVATVPFRVFPASSSSSSSSSSYPAATLQPPPPPVLTSPSSFPVNIIDHTNEQLTATIEEELVKQNKKTNKPQDSTESSLSSIILFVPSKYQTSSVNPTDYLITSPLIEVNDCDDYYNNGCRVVEDDNDCGDADNDDLVGDGDT